MMRGAERLPAAMVRDGLPLPARCAHGAERGRGNASGKRSQQHSSQ